MGTLGISLIAASLVLFFLRPPAWLRSYLRSWRLPRIHASPEELDGHQRTSASQGGDGREQQTAARKENSAQQAPMESESIAEIHTVATPPRISVEEPMVLQVDGSPSDEGETTPKAKTTFADTPSPTPLFTASAPENAPSNEQNNIHNPVPQILSPTSSPALQPPRNAAAGLMLPPPRPQARIPSLNPVSAQGSLSPYADQRRLPIPNRGPSAQAPATSTLAPPPTHSSRPTPPRRPVTLEAGHSPLDWARLSSDPSKNLSGLAPGMAYLRVAPSQLKAHNGRKGRDAWMALGSVVYNITPYLPFHPGGVGELMRGAGKDGTRLFGEIHPWVNYENMLTSCMVGVLVEEGAGFGQKAEAESEMDNVD